LKHKNSVEAKPSLQSFLFTSSWLRTGWRIPNPSDENGKIKGVIPIWDNPFVLLVPRAGVPPIDSGQLHRHGGGPTSDCTSLADYQAISHHFPI